MNRRWLELYEEIDGARGQKKDWLNGLVVQVRRAAEKKLCATFEPYRIRPRGDVIEIAPRSDGATIQTQKAFVPAIALSELPALQNARMSFRVKLRADHKAIEQYTISVVGEERTSQRPWYARIDLDPQQRGQGPCGHPLLHCHVGVDHTEKNPQETRVPLPWLAPDAAVQWVLATLDPRFEP